MPMMMAQHCATIGLIAGAVLTPASIPGRGRMEYNVHAQLTQNVDPVSDQQQSV